MIHAFKIYKIYGCEVAQEILGLFGLKDMDAAIISRFLGLLATSKILDPQKRCAVKIVVWVFRKNVKFYEKKSSFHWIKYKIVLVSTYILHRQHRSHNLIGKLTLTSNTNPTIPKKWQLRYCASTILTATSCGKNLVLLQVQKVFRGKYHVTRIRYHHFKETVTLLKLNCVS